MTAHPSKSPLSSRSIVGFLGPLGTGKTEIAINYSLASLAAGRPTCLSGGGANRKGAAHHDAP